VLVKKPSAKEIPDDYYNQLLQGVCDHKWQFLDVCVRSFGSCHNATHFKMSSIWHKMQNDELLNKL
jgi:hypothetical protein